MQRSTPGYSRYHYVSSFMVLMSIGIYFVVGCTHSISSVADASSQQLPQPTKTMSDRKELDYISTLAGLRLALTASDTLWNSGKQVQVILHIENTTSSKVKLAVRGAFLLTRREVGDESQRDVDTFYSLLQIQNEENRESGVIHDYLEAGQALDIPVEVMKLKWGRINSAVRPNKGLFETVPQGQYLLRFEIKEKSGSYKSPDSSTEIPLFNASESNRLEISIH